VQTRPRDLAASTVAGTVALLLGVTIWRLGIEFERAWLRSYEDAYEASDDLQAQLLDRGLTAARQDKDARPLARGTLRGRVPQHARAAARVVGAA